MLFLSFFLPNLYALSPSKTKRNRKEKQQITKNWIPNSLYYSYIELVSIMVRIFFFYSYLFFFLYFFFSGHRLVLKIPFHAYFDVDLTHLITLVRSLLSHSGGVHLDKQSVINRQETLDQPPLFFSISKLSLYLYRR